MARTLLNAVTTAATGTSVKKLRNDIHTMVVSYTNVTGAMSALSVSLEGSLDNSTFFVLGTLTFSQQELTDLSAALNVTGKLANYVRAKVDTATTTGTYTITVTWEGGSTNA